MCKRMNARNARIEANEKLLLEGDKRNWIKNSTIEMRNQNMKEKHNQIVSPLSLISMLAWASLNFTEIRVACKMNIRMI